jgi:hypothetical protein
MLQHPAKTVWKVPKYRRNAHKNARSAKISFKKSLCILPKKGVDKRRDMRYSNSVSKGAAGITICSADII